MSEILLLVTGLHWIYWACWGCAVQVWPPKGGIQRTGRLLTFVYLIYSLLHWASFCSFAFIQPASLGFFLHLVQARRERLFSARMFSDHERMMKSITADDVFITGILTNLNSRTDQRSWRRLWQIFLCFMCALLWVLWANPSESTSRDV